MIKAVNHGERRWTRHEPFPRPICRPTKKTSQGKNGLIGRHYGAFMEDLLALAAAKRRLALTREIRASSGIRPGDLKPVDGHAPAFYKIHTSK